MEELDHTSARITFIRAGDGIAASAWVSSLDNRRHLAQPRSARRLLDGADAGGATKTSETTSTTRWAEEETADNPARRRRSHRQTPADGDAATVTWERRRCASRDIHHEHANRAPHTPGDRPLTSRLRRALLQTRVYSAKQLQFLISAYTPPAIFLYVVHPPMWRAHHSIFLACFDATSGILPL